MKTKKIRFALWLLLLIIGSQIHLAKIIGGSTFALAGFAFLFPILGALVPFSLVGGTMFSLIALKYLFRGMPVTLGLPTLIATLSWTCTTNNNKILDVCLHVFLPITCMVIFIAYTASPLAWPFALYWIIPPICWGFRHHTNNQSLWIASLQSSFVAHAAGSIMWLFLRPLSPAQWFSLIPVVAIERLTLAMLGTATLYAVTKCAIVASSFDRLWMSGLAVQTERAFRPEHSRRSWISGFITRSK